MIVSSLATAHREPGSRERGHEVRALGYITGHAGALALGLLAAYLALAWSGAGDAATKSIKTVDFMTYYSTFRLILEGHGGALYDPHALGLMERRLTLPLHTPYGVLPYLYPGYFALIFAPLGYLPYGIAYLVWLALNCVLLATSLYFLERVISPSRRTSLILRGAALCFLPVFMSLGLGQASMMLLAIFVLGWWALRSGRDDIAGATLALATFKPYYLLPVLVVILARRRWRAVWTLTVTSCLLLVAPLPILGWSSLGTWLRTLVTASTWQGSSGAVIFDHVSVARAVYAPEWNHSVAGLLELLMAPRAAAVGGLLFALAALAVLAVRARVASLDLTLGLAMLIGLLISPHTLIYDLTLLLFPAAIALSRREFCHVPIGPAVTALYVAVTVGYRLVFVVPLQLSALAMLGITGWYVLALSRDSNRSRRMNA